MVESTSMLLCLFAPLALVGMMGMLELRVVLAVHGVRAITRALRTPQGLVVDGSGRTAVLAAGNVLVPMLASAFGMAVLAPHLGLPPLASQVLHGLNAAQAMLGLALTGLLLSRW